MKCTLLASSLLQTTVGGRGKSVLAPSACSTPRPCCDSLSLHCDVTGAKTCENDLVALTAPLPNSQHNPHFLDDAASAGGRKQNAAFFIAPAMLTVVAGKGTVEAKGEHLST